ncbi:DUF6932 family protein [Runella limosa]|jgi:hypothetical protein|uniref:DUF6932 family protein n=1 Tax=Runella limosa TaxID=370978 RepID=UPI000420A2F9
MIFDQYGHLFPYEVVPTDFDTFETVFVKNFPSTSKRHQWFKNYVTYVDELKHLLGTGFTQWIDGSFVSQKFNPNDIDFVTFIDFELYERFEKEIELIRKKRYQRTNGTDGYFIKTYPIDHKLQPIYQLERKRWLFDFTMNLYNKRPKGIIQLSF